VIRYLLQFLAYYLTAERSRDGNEKAVPLLPRESGLLRNTSLEREKLKVLGDHAQRQAETILRLIRKKALGTLLQ
jgi:hypothetical protein